MMFLKGPKGTKSLGNLPMYQYVPQITFKNRQIWLHWVSRIFYASLCKWSWVRACLAYVRRCVWVYEQRPTTEWERESVAPCMLSQPSSSSTSLLLPPSLSQPTAMHLTEFVSQLSCVSQLHNKSPAELEVFQLNRIKTGKKWKQPI